MNHLDFEKLKLTREKQNLGFFFQIIVLKNIYFNNDLTWQSFVTLFVFCGVELAFSGTLKALREILQNGAIKKEQLSICGKKLSQEK